MTKSKVWIVTREMDFEGSEIIGVARTVPNAKFLAKEHMLYFSGDKIVRWNKGDYGNDYYSAIVVGKPAIHYALNKMEVYDGD